MADLVCNQRCTPGVWVDLATTKAAGPTGQPARLGRDPYRTEQLARTSVAREAPTAAGRGMKNPQHGNHEGGARGRGGSGRRPWR